MRLTSSADNEGQQNNKDNGSLHSSCPAKENHPITDPNATQTHFKVCVGGISRTLAVRGSWRRYIMIILDWGGGGWRRRMVHWDWESPPGLRVWTAEMKQNNGGTQTVRSGWLWKKELQCELIYRKPRTKSGLGGKTWTHDNSGVFTFS